MRTRRIQVIGAGCVGPVMSILLARRGYHVQLHERRAMDRQGQGSGVSINLAISARGLHALDLAGMKDKVLAAAVPMRGRMIHPLTGQPYFIPYSRDGRAIFSIRRSLIAQLCIEGVEELAEGKVEIIRGSRLVDYDPVAGRAVFVDQAGAEQSVTGEPVIGADGAFSAMRSSLARRGSLTESVGQLNIEYRELLLPATFNEKARLASDALHIWPRNGMMLIALPNVDGSFTFTLFSPSEESATWTPSTLKSAESADAFFRATFPDLAAAAPEAGASLASAYVGRIPLVSCSPWNAGQAVVMGDAAHAITPFFGQGLNAGLEDCVLLDEMLDDVGTDVDWAGVFQRFGASRAPDTAAIAALSLENLDEMSRAVTDPAFLLRKNVEAEIQRRYPGLYLSRYELVSFSRLAYRSVVEIGQLQRELLDEVCDNVRDPAEVDYARAAALISERLSHRFPTLDSNPQLSSEPPQLRASA